MFGLYNDISSIWSTAFLNCSRVSVKFSPYVQKCYSMTEFFLKKEGYIKFYQLSRDYTQAVRKVQSEVSEELFIFAASRHEDPTCQDQLVLYLNDIIKTSYKYLSAESLSINKKLLDLLSREDLNDGVSLYSVITEFIKKEFSDANVVRIKKQETIFGKFALEIYNLSHTENEISDEDITAKYTKIIKVYQVPLGVRLISEPNEEKTKLFLQKLAQIKKVTTKHFRAVLCYDLLDDIYSHLLEKDIDEMLYSTYLFYIYLIKKIVGIWMGNFLSNKHTLINASHLPDLLQTMMEVNKDYQFVIKEHPKIARKSNSQRELDRKSAGVTASELYETINL